LRPGKAWPDDEHAERDGPLPTVIAAVTRFVAVSITDTLPEPSLVM
jgi:hypothetical protein